jgi:hypothetical protein
MSPLWLQILGFFAGGALAGAVFLVLAYRAERRAGRGD